MQLKKTKFDQGTKSYVHKEMNNLNKSEVSKTKWDKSNTDLMRHTDQVMQIPKYAVECLLTSSSELLNCITESQISHDRNQKG